MIPKILEEEAFSWMNEAFHQEAPKWEKLLCEDALFQGSALQELLEKFKMRFSLEEKSAQWLFYKTLNDSLLAEKNYITCPIW